MEDFDSNAVIRGIPAGIIGNPRDIGRLAIFLASDEARYIIGQTFVIDGGQTAVMPQTNFREPVPYQFGQGYVPDL